MGRCYSATVFLTAGNITHTPGYGNLIALGILEAVQQRNVSQDQIAERRRAIASLIARTGRFLTFSAGAATIGYRMREDPRERVALRIVRETDAGLVLRGKVGMHTSPRTPRTSTSAATRGSIAAASRDLRRGGERARRHGRSAARCPRATRTRSCRR